MKRWRDEHGYREFDPITWSVRVTDCPRDLEVDVDVSEFAIGSEVATSRTKTPEIDRVALDDLLSRCKPTERGKK